MSANHLFANHYTLLIIISASKIYFEIFCISFYCKKFKIVIYFFSFLGVEEHLTCHDLDSVLLHFNIQPRNPLCILSQDTARSFFKSCDPKHMYQLFMQGTQLETVRVAYQKNKDSLARLNKENKRNEEVSKKFYIFSHFYSQQLR